MSEFSSHDLSLYVVGQAPVDLTRRIEEQAKVDHELAAQLALMASVAGAPLHAASPSGSPDVRQRGERPRRICRWFTVMRALLVVVASGTVIAGVGWAGWMLLATHPLMQDNFNDRWADARLWVCGRPAVREENGYMRFVNRGYLVTKAEYPGPIAVSFDWRWIDLAGHFDYADVLTVALRTSGRPRPKHSYEARDGVLVKLDAAAGKVAILLASDFDEQPTSWTAIASTPDGAIAIPAEEWHHVRITDDGERIAVYCTGPEIHEKDRNKPILEVRCTQETGSHHVAIYNREFLAEVPHESHIDNFVLSALPTLGQSKRSHK